MQLLVKKKYLSACVFSDKKRMVFRLCFNSAENSVETVYRLFFRGPACCKTNQGVVFVIRLPETEVNLFPELCHRIVFRYYKLLIRRRIDKELAFVYFEYLDKIFCCINSML